MDWIWHGTPGHFVAAHSCCFRMHTTVGKYRVSSVGCYHPASDPDGPAREIGSGRLYETMVFEENAVGVVEDWVEVDADGYQSELEAERGHVAMCEKWEARNG